MNELDVSGGALERVPQSHIDSGEGSSSNDARYFERFQRHAVELRRHLAQRAVPVGSYALHDLLCP